MYTGLNSLCWTVLKHYVNSSHRMRMCYFIYFFLWNAQMIFWRIFTHFYIPFNGFHVCQVLKQTKINPLENTILLLWCFFSLYLDPYRPLRTCVVWKRSKVKILSFVGCTIELLLQGSLFYKKLYCLGHKLCKGWTRSFKTMRCSVWLSLFLRGCH